MAIGNGIRAYSNPKYNYYELTKPIGCKYFNRQEILLPAGAIFVHDTDDHEQGSIAEGCLKLCWNPDGNTYGSLCANTVVLHAAFKDTDMFRLTKVSRKSNCNKLLDKIKYLKSKITELTDEIEKVENELKANNEGGD